MPTLAQDHNARLLWYANHAHGTGLAYNVVTITGIADGAAWETLARRAHSGDLAPWMRELDNLRHEVTGKILLPVEWSPLQEVDLTTVPTDGATHPLSLFMEDTGWPYAPLDDYRPEALLEASAALNLTVEQLIQAAVGGFLREKRSKWERRGCVRKVRTK